MESTIACILAAGYSQRMGRPKALLPFKGKTFVEIVASLYEELGVPWIVVLGAEHRRIRSLVPLPDDAVLVNPRPELGPLSSLQLALRSLPSRVTGLFLHPVDHPLVRPGTVAALLDAHRNEPEAILLPLHGDRRGHPALFPRSRFEDLLAAPLDKGARWVVRQSSECVREIPVPDPGIHRNINTPEDFARWVDAADAEIDDSPEFRS